MALNMRCEKGHSYIVPDIVDPEYVGPICPQCHEEWLKEASETSRRERPMPLRVRIESDGLMGGTHIATADGGDLLACTKVEYVFDAAKGFSQVVLHCNVALFTYEGEAKILCTGCPHGDKE